MEAPEISPLPEESGEQSVPGNELKTPSPSIRQSLADITKQFINWPRFEVDLKVEAKTDHEAEYSLSKAQWTPKFPTNFEEDSSEKEQSKQPVDNEPQNEYSLEKAQWTPKFPANFEEDLSEKEQSNQLVNNVSQDEYSLEKAQWTPKFPINFEEDLSEKEQPKQPEHDVPEGEFSLSKAQWTPKWSDVINKANNSTKVEEKKNYNQKKTDSKESLGLSKTSPDSTQRMEDAGTKSKVDEKENDDNFLKDQRPSSKSDHDDSPRVNSYTTNLSKDQYNYKTLTEDVSFPDVSTTTITSGAKKWYVNLGTNRNYIKALIHHDINNNWKRVATVKETVKPEPREQEKTEPMVKTRPVYRWNVQYDNLNYIRSFLSPEIIEKILGEELDTEKKILRPYREVSVS